MKLLRKLLLVLSVAGFCHSATGSDLYFERGPQMEAAMAMTRSLGSNANLLLGHVIANSAPRSLNLLALEFDSSKASSEYTFEDLVRVHFTGVRHMGKHVPPMQYLTEEGRALSYEVPSLDSAKIEIEHNQRATLIYRLSETAVLTVRISVGNANIVHGRQFSVSLTDSALNRGFSNGFSVSGVGLLNSEPLFQRETLENPAELKRLLIDSSVEGMFKYKIVKGTNRGFTGAWTSFASGYAPYTYGSQFTGEAALKALEVARKEMSQRGASLLAGRSRSCRVFL